MPDDEFNAICQWLRFPTTYPFSTQNIEVKETHISVVFVVGGFAYKLKHRVKFDFLDFTTLDGRERACREELRLNRRLAKDFYLGVIPVILDADGSLHLGGRGVVIDWLVHMRRLPLDMSLEALLVRGELQPNHIDQLSATLSHFYERLPPLDFSPDKYRHQYIEHVQGNLRELISVSHHCPTNVVRRIHGFQLQLLNLQPGLFDQRVKGGCIVDGHGDLRPEHICFSQPLAIFDCVEFSPEFRRIDVADELAFLASECDFLGAPWVGKRLLEAMQSKSDVRPPNKLIDFYKSYRACVRAKVNALRADQLTDSRIASESALKHLMAADSYAKQWTRPLVIVVGGLSGTGKSTLATQIAHTLGCELLQTDAIRQELFGKSQRPAEFKQDNYTDNARQQVYTEMFCRAELRLQDRVSLVLDGTFSKAITINEAKAVADRATAAFFAIQCVCNPETAQQVQIEWQMKVVRPKSVRNFSIGNRSIGSNGHRVFCNIKSTPKSK